MYKHISWLPGDAGLPSLFGLNFTSLVTRASWPQWDSSSKVTFVGLLLLHFFSDGFCKKTFDGFCFLFQMGFSDVSIL
jgi:hypothetical protein